MRFLLHREVKHRAPRALAWVKEFLGRFDTSGVAWLRIDFGREYQDRRGRSYRKYRGVYGRCWYPSARQPHVRISCQVPGPFPCDIVTRLKPVYRNPDGTWPPAARLARGPVFENQRSGRQWKRVYGATTVQDLDEAIVWIVSHESFHWLRKTGQIPGRNTEVEADAFGDRQLAEFRKSPLALATPPPSLEPDAAHEPPFRSRRRKEAEPTEDPVLPPRDLGGYRVHGPDARPKSEVEAPHEPPSLPRSERGRGRGEGAPVVQSAKVDWKELPARSSDSLPTTSAAGRGGESVARAGRHVFRNGQGELFDLIGESA